jgi:hypothetical protein
MGPWEDTYCISIKAHREAKDYSPSGETSETLESQRGVASTKDEVVRDRANYWVNLTIRLSVMKSL